MLQKSYDFGTMSSKMGRDFFFLISNENFIKKLKTANPSTLGMYYWGHKSKTKITTIK